jgi:hypothetical protein
MEKNFGFWFGAKVFSTPWCVVTKKKCPPWERQALQQLKLKLMVKIKMLTLLA